MHEGLKTVFVPLHDSNPLVVIQFQIVTVTLIVINVAVFLAFHFEIFNQREIVEILTYGVIPAEIVDGGNVYKLPVPVAEELTLVSYMFLHGGWMHLIGNMLFLWVFGDNVEDSMGHLRFLVFYLLCGVAAALAHIYWSPSSETPLVGASGAIAGVLGAYLVLHPKAQVWVLLFMRIPVRLPAMWVLAGWIGFQIFSAYATGSAVEGGESVAWWAHIGGFIAGVLLVFVFRSRRSGAAPA